MKSNYRRLGNYIREVNSRDSDQTIDLLLGVSIQKKFIPSIANIVGTDMSTYKIVKRNQFAYGPVTSRNGDKISIALLESNDEAIISQAYSPFEVRDTNELDPEYLMMWFRRPEFDRYARFMSHGSARETFSWEEMCNTLLPIPSITKQREIVKEYNIIQNRIALNQQLIQKLEETAQAIYKQWFVDFEFPDEKGKPYKSSGGEMVFNEELEMDIPFEWKVMALSEVASYINRGITPKYTENDGIVVINQKCVRGNSIDFSFARKHNEKLKKIDPNRYLQRFDILVNSTGEGTLGRVGLVKEKHSRLIVDTHVTVVRASEILMPLCLWFNLSTRTGEIEKLAEGSTGQTELGKNNLGELQIIIPSSTIQKHFERIAAPFVACSSKTEKEVPVLMSFKELLLSKLATIEN